MFLVVMTSTETIILAEFRLNPIMFLAIRSLVVTGIQIKDIMVVVGIMEEQRILTAIPFGLFWVLHWEEQLDDL
jgi:hypothetical protein